MNPARRRPSRVATLLLLLLVFGLAGCSRRGVSASVPRAAASAPDPVAGGRSAPSGGQPTEQWRWDAPPLGNVGAPAADPAGIAFTYGHIGVVLLDAAGHEQWRTTEHFVLDIAPALTPDLVLVALDEGIAALDRSTGATRWVGAVGDRPTAPAVAGSTAAATTWEGDLVGFDLRTGRRRWRHPLGAPALGPAAAVPGPAPAIVATADGGAFGAARVVVVDAATGRRRWGAALPSGGVSGPAVVGVPGGQLVVVVAGDGAAHAFDAATGAPRWRTPVGSAGSPEVAPVRGGERLVVAGRLGDLALVDPATGEVEHRQRVDGLVLRAGPAVDPLGRWVALPLDDGRLFVAVAGAPGSLMGSPGRISGVAALPAPGDRGGGALLLVAGREAEQNALAALGGFARG